MIQGSQDFASYSSSVFTSELDPPVVHAASEPVGYSLQSPQYLSFAQLPQGMPAVPSALSGVTQTQYWGSPIQSHPAPPAGFMGSSTSNALDAIPELENLRLRAEIRLTASRT